MAKTAVADIIIPTEFEKYAIERTAELSRFGQCGIVEYAPEFDALAAGGGREVKMPFWKDLTATRQLLSDSASLTVNKITSDQDIARIHNDAQVWSVNHLAKVISGDDPMQAIVDLVAAYFLSVFWILPSAPCLVRPPLVRRWRVASPLLVGCWRVARSLLHRDSIRLP